MQYNVWIVHDIRHKFITNVLINSLRTKYLYESTRFKRALNNISPICLRFKQNWLYVFVVKVCMLTVPQFPPLYDLNLNIGWKVVNGEWPISLLDIYHKLIIPIPFTYRTLIQPVTVNKTRFAIDIRCKHTHFSGQSFGTWSVGISCPLI